MKDRLELARNYVGHFCHVHYDVAGRRVDFEWRLGGKARRLSKKPRGLRFVDVGEVCFPKPDTHCFGELEHIEIDNQTGPGRCVIRVAEGGEVSFSFRRIQRLI